MSTSLEQYVSQATQAYQPAVNALQSQLDSLDSRLANTNEQINRSYQQQQADLNRNRNMAAESASMQAAGSGGSFGGSANLANRRYYDKTFVPAVTQMRTNQANDLASARQASDDMRNSLNNQLANMQSQANQQALAQFYADQEAERNRAAQIAAAKAANPYQYMDDGMGNSGNNGTVGYKNWDFGDGYAIQQHPSGEAIYTHNGKAISAGQFLNATGAKGARWDLWNDIWNNGVSTRGVGSDTVEAFNKFSPNGYSYLF